MEEKIRQEKKQNGFVRILKILFVNNFTYKLFAVLFGVLLWLLSVGLGNNGLL
jgi:hypothetical protein